MRIFILLFFTIFIAACGGTETPINTTANSKPATSNTAVVTTNNPLETTKTPEVSTTNNAPTIAPVVQKYYEALRKKDDAALKTVYTQAALKSLEADMKEEKKTSLVEFITELEPAPDTPFIVRNEQIQGDTAVAEIRGGSYPNGIKMEFIKENGEWKMTGKSPEIQSVKQSASNTNSAK